MSETTRYPLDQVAARLREAGWNGQAKPGWLFAAHVAAEAGHGPGPVLDQLRRKLGVDDSAALVLAATLVSTDHDTAGPRPRKQLDVAEAAIGWKVSQAGRRQ